MSQVVSLIVPTYNCAEDILRLLNSVQKLNYELRNVEIIIVDNASTDRTIAVVEAFFHEHQNDFFRLVVFKNTENAGAPKALNKALSLCSPISAYIWKLDSDTELDSQSLAALLKEFVDNPMTGAVVSNILDSEGKTTPVYTTVYKSFRKWTKTTDGFFFTDLSAEKVDGLSGASILFQKSILDIVGNFDENFFLYYDDTDLCYRIKKAGFTLRCAEDSLVLHFMKNKTGEPALRGMYYTLRSQFYFFVKHHSLPDTILFFLVQLLISPWRVRKICIYYHCSGLRLYFKAYMLWWKSAFDFARSYNGVFNG